MNHHSLNLAMEYESRDEEFELVHADRSLNPLSNYIYYLYRKWRKSKHGRDNGEDMFNQLQLVVKKYNKDNEGDGGRAFLQCYEGKVTKDTKGGEQICHSQPLVLAVCTPLMARAHQYIRQAGELIYCDSTASLDRYNCPTFVMSTCTSAGGIPLGTVITSGESEIVLTEAMSCLKSVLPQNAFYGRGVRGPEVYV